MLMNRQWEIYKRAVRELLCLFLLVISMYNVYFNYYFYLLAIYIIITAPVYDNTLLNLLKLFGDKT